VSFKSFRVRICGAFLLGNYRSFLPTTLQPFLGPGLPQEEASIPVCVLLVSSILVLLGSVMCYSERRPSILFLVLPRVVYYEISY